MQRQRRKDLNLKINRVLDKRSSRGMIFENEELRLRTMAIADDVDRGQNDIKKLRKENEHLKREIWNLRDECEKLEEILKKVVAYGGIPLDPDLPFPELLLENQRDSFDEGSIEEDEHMAHLRNMFMMDEDQTSNTGSVVEIQSTSNVENVDNQNQNSPEVLSDIQSQPKFGHYSHSHPWGPAAIPPDLEAVREETESIVTSLTSVASTSSNPTNSNIDQLPDPSQYLIGFEELSPPTSDTPLIEITPASSPPLNPSDSEQPLTPDGDRSGGEMSPESESIQDGGCVAVLPKMFQVTSQIHFDNSSDNNHEQPKLVDIDQNVLNGLPPPSPNVRGNLSKTRLAMNTTKDSDSKDSTSSYSTDSMSTTNRPHSVSGDQPSKQSTSRRMYLSNRNSHIVNSPAKTSSFGFIVNRCCPNFHSCYQSDPSSLATGGSVGGSAGHLTFDLDPSTTGGFCYPFLSSCHSVNVMKPSWNSIDTNLVVGYIKGDTKHIKPQDVIDELELKFDSSLEKVKGIRMLAGRVFISFREPSSVKFLLDNYNSESTDKSFLVKGLKVVFMDTKENCSEVSLYGIPPEVSDLAVTSVLNQYGQVVAPLERRNYKGIDISERFARMHLVKSVPNVLTIGGYEVSLTISNMPNECQTDNEEHQVPAASLTCQHVSFDKFEKDSARPPVVTSNTSSSSGNTGCVNNLVTCHSSPVMSNNIIQQQPQTSEQTVSNNSGLKPHKQVVRSTSSNPRLESGPAPLSPVVTKRQSSVCTGNILPEEHPSKILTPQQQQMNPKTLKVIGGTNSAPNLLPGNPKKPLSRLLRSSPGSLVPPNAANIMAGAKLIEPHDQQPPAAMNQSGLRAAFYRSLSIDPRRGSTSSQQAGENNNIDKLGVYSRRGSTAVFQGRLGGYGGGHLPLTQMNSNSSSQLESRDSVVRGFGGSGSTSNKPLPWCGCWGNGCI